MKNKIKFYLMIHSLMTELADRELFRGVKNVYCICDRSIAWILNYRLKAKGIKVWLCSEELVKTKVRRNMQDKKDYFFVVEECMEGKITGILEKKGVQSENYFVIPVRLDKAGEIV